MKHQELHVYLCRPLSPLKRWNVGCDLKAWLIDTCCKLFDFDWNHRFLVFITRWTWCYHRRGRGHFSSINRGHRCNNKRFRGQWSRPCWLQNETEGWKCGTVWIQVSFRRRRWVILRLWLFVSSVQRCFVGLHVAIAVPGWVREGEVISQQWTCLDVSPEQYCLLWDTKYLLELGSSLQYIKDMVVNAAMSQALKYTVLSTVMAAVAWPAALLGASSVIDNPWSVHSLSLASGSPLRLYLETSHEKVLVSMLEICT